MAKTNEITRLDDRALLRQLVRELVDGGYCLDELDVKLSQIVPVDLDLLHECFLEVEGADASARRAA
ncbi:hypothetical protein [Aquibium sp. ELW1220]|uniref:hypothetical protein n=1 Tax=Aquibium sp. ELW1220 TaxID=2976766 RepID=UPI0025B1E38D|nr:hypothetical protein [Aquibium sp. ELW1220]MDN2579767.1 hypothetical protein [Aquibium sp. ELW1220]